MQVAEHGQNPEVLIKRHHAWPWIVLLLLFLVASACGAVAYQFYKQAMEVKDHEQHAVQMLQGMSGGSGLDAFDKMQSSLPQAQKETGEAKAITQNKLWNLAARLPVVGNDVKNVQGMVGSTDSIMRNSLPQFVTIFNNLKSANISSDDGQLNLQPIVAAQQSMQDANDSFQGDVKNFRSLPEPRISQISKVYYQADSKLTKVGNQIDQLTNMMNVLPQFLGQGQPRTYLLAAMTPSEARSSGGLIGSIGTMTVDDGKISIGDFRSNTDYLPYGNSNPSQDDLNTFRWWGPLNMSFDIRDSGVYPETARVAQAVKTIWNKTPWGAEQNVDAVITLDPVFLQEINKVNGNVSLRNGQVLDGNNTAEFLLNTVYKDFSPQEQDVYFAQVADQSMEHVFSGMNMSKLVKAGQSMGSMAKNRHFNMYAFDENLEKPLDDAGLTAHIPDNEVNPTVGIYINNQVGSKIEWYIHRKTTITPVSCVSHGVQTYHVVYNLTNILTAAQAQALPNYIIGQNSNSAQTGGWEKVLLYAPKGGNISNLQINGNVTGQRNVLLNGTSVQASVARIMPGQSATYSFDVTTSPKAVSELSVDQTPMGWTNSGVTVDNNNCPTSIGRR